RRRGGRPGLGRPGQPGRVGRRNLRDRQPARRADPAHGGPAMREVAAPGRWIWGLSGLVTMVALALPGIRLITSGGQAENAQPQATVTRTVTVTQPVTSLTVQSYGAPVQITAGPVRRVQITKTIMYDSRAGNLSAGPQPASASPVSDPPAVPQPAPASPVSDPPAGPQPAPASPLSGMPAVVQSLSGGRLSLSAPACATSGCSVSFALTVPPQVTATVSTEGGPVTVSGIAGANLDSGGGPVRATEIGGPLTVITDGGSLMVDGLTGPLLADTGGGSLTRPGRRLRDRHGHHGQRRRVDGLLGGTGHGDAEHRRWFRAAVRG